MCGGSVFGFVKYCFLNNIYVCFVCILVPGASAWWFIVCLFFFYKNSCRKFLCVWLCLWCVFFYLYNVHKSALVNTHISKFTSRRDSPQINWVPISAWIMFHYLKKALQPDRLILYCIRGVGARVRSIHAASSISENLINTKLILEIGNCFYWHTRKSIKNDHN